MSSHNSKRSRKSYEMCTMWLTSFTVLTMHVGSVCSLHGLYEDLHLLAFPLIHYSSSSSRPSICVYSTLLTNSNSYNYVKRAKRNGKATERGLFLVRPLAQAATKYYYMYKETYD